MHQSIRKNVKLFSYFIFKRVMDLEVYLCTLCDLRVTVLIATYDKEGLHQGFCSHLAAFQRLEGGPCAAGWQLKPWQNSRGQDMVTWPVVALRCEEAGGLVRKWRGS